MKDFYKILPSYNCSTGKTKSQFFPHTIFPFSILKRRNFLASRYLLYCGCGCRRINSPTSTVCTVLSLNVRQTVRLPMSVASVIYNLSIPCFLLYSFLYIRTSYRFRPSTFAMWMSLVVRLKRTL